MVEGRGWIAIVVAIVLVVCLLGFARGRDHRRGDEVGAFAPVPGVWIAD